MLYEDVADAGRSGQKERLPRLRVILGYGYPKMFHEVAALSVQVYEKIKLGIWSDNGYFHLVDSWVQPDENRNVFKFKLVAIENVEDETQSEDITDREVKRSRIIPTSVKLEVWKRDKGKCVTCGETDELHFDHILPYSKGGTSLKPENIQLLCARHNLEKSAKIQ